MHIPKVLGWIGQWSHGEPNIYRATPQTPVEQWVFPYRVGSISVRWRPGNDWPGAHEIIYQGPERAPGGNRLVCPDNPQSLANFIRHASRFFREVTTEQATVKVSYFLSGNHPDELKKHAGVEVGIRGQWALGWPAWPDELLSLCYAFADGDCPAEVLLDWLTEKDDELARLLANHPAGGLNPNIPPAK